MKKLLGALALAGSWAAHAYAPTAQAPVTIEIVSPGGGAFREIPVETRDGSLRSYLQAEKGARYALRIHNTTGERLGLVIAVDGRNIIDGRKSELARSERMYVLDGGQTQSYAGWRASLDAINEFYFTDFADSYAEAFGDRSARGVIAVAVYREEPPVEDPEPAQANAPTAPAAASRGRAEEKSARDESAGTGYGDRRDDRAYEVEFVAQSEADSRHFIKYEWRETLCRRQILDCGEKNRFWDESVLGFAPPPPRRR
jgi:hypothetical protein